MSSRRRGIIRIQTLRKFLHLYNESRGRRRLLTAMETSLILGCSKGHAYNYVRALKVLYDSLIA